METTNGQVNMDAPTLDVILEEEDIDKEINKEYQFYFRKLALDEFYEKPIEIPLRICARCRKPIEGNMILHKQPRVRTVMHVDKSLFFNSP